MITLTETGDIRPERILLTNDDGIDSENFKGLARWAAARWPHAELVVAAPLTQQSAKSQAILLEAPFAVTRREAWRDYAARPIAVYAVDSTPADCVRWAWSGLNYPFDFVLSGINRGFNVGTDILYSGTVSAMLEAGVSDDGVYAAALSTDFGDCPGALDSLDFVFDYFAAHKLWAAGRLFNVNIPPKPPKGVCITKQGDAFFKDRFEEVSPGLWRAAGYSIYANTLDLTSDRDTALSGYVSITPITTYRTDLAVYETIKRQSACE